MKRIFFAEEVLGIVSPSNWGGTSATITHNGKLIACTNEDATQTGLAGQQGDDNRVVAPEQVKLTELAKAS